MFKDEVEIYSTNFMDFLLGMILEDHSLKEKKERKLKKESEEQEIKKSLQRFKGVRACINDITGVIEDIYLRADRFVVIKLIADEYLHLSHFVLEAKYSKELIAELDLSTRNIINPIVFSEPVTSIIIDNKITSVKVSDQDEYDWRTGYLMAFFQSKTGFNKTQTGRFFDNLEKEYLRQTQK